MIIRHAKRIFLENSACRTNHINCVVRNKGGTVLWIRNQSTDDLNMPIALSSHILGIELNLQIINRIEIVLHFGEYDNI